VSYGQLLGGKLFNTAMAAQSISQLQAPAKPASQYTLVGIADVPRIDIPAKVTGAYTYIQNVRVPNMLHARVVRPRGQGAYGDGTNFTVISVDPNSINGIGDARVLQRGNLLAVVATNEYDAIQAAAQLKVVWGTPPKVSSSGDLFSSMRTFYAAGQAPVTTSVNTGNISAGLASAAHTVSATYSYAYQGHVPIGPACAVADVTSQGAYVLGNMQDA
jgi:CO/xanthine dehydrogenase Mo-binding subunit